MGTHIYLHVKISNRNFENVGVTLDNQRFENCTFKNCKVLYSGGPVELDSCRFEGETQWLFQGAAGLTVETMRTLGWKIEPPK